MGVGDGCAPPTGIIATRWRSRPAPGSPTGIRGARVGNGAYDLYPDGRRIAALAAKDQGSAGQDKVVFVFNFPDDLQEIAPGTPR